MPQTSMNWLRGSTPARRSVDRPPSAHTTRWHAGWFTLIGIGVAACILAILLPEHSTVWVANYEGVAILALVVFAIAGLRMPPGARLVWWALWCFQALTFAGEAVYDAQHSEGDPWAIPALASLLYLSAYVAVFIALSVLIRSAHPGRDREAWIDAAIMAIAAASIIGIFIIEPAMVSLGEPGLHTFVALIYPLLDLGVLGLMIWLLFGTVHLSPVLALLTGAFTFYLTADLLYEYRLVNGLADRTWVWREAMYLAAVVLIAAAATAPGADTITHPASTSHRRATPIRVAGLVAAVVIVPLLLTVAVWQDRLGSDRLLAIASLLVIGLGLWRARILLTTIARHQQFNELILDSAGDGIVGLDPDGNVVFVNLAARRLLRCREDDIVERNFHDVAHHHHPDGSAFPWDDCPTRSLLNQGRSGSLASQTFFRRDGVPLPVDVIITPMSLDHERAGAVMLFRDISERAAVEEMKSQFIAVVSHELRTPLTSIMGSLKLLDSGVVGQVTPEQQQLVTMAVNNSARLRTLVDDILDVERLDAGRMPLRPERVSALTLAEQAVEGITGSAQAAGVPLSVAADADRACLDIVVDPHRMLQVLANLLGNAIKFSERGAPVLVHVGRSDQDVFWAVEDHGRGIPADRLSTVFERFGQVESGDARRQGGTGLGLAIAKELVTRSGGGLEVTSEPGRGSTFTVTLPAASTQGQP